MVTCIALSITGCAVSDLIPIGDDEVIAKEAVSTKPIDFKELTVEFRESRAKDSVDTLMEVVRRERQKLVKKFGLPEYMLNFAYETEYKDGKQVMVITASIKPTFREEFERKLERVKRMLEEGA